jgi:hypothetical protein
MENSKDSRGNYNEYGIHREVLGAANGKKSIQDGRGFSLGAFASLIERPLLFSGCEVLRR